MTPMYTAVATATGDGRNGHATSEDGILDLDLRIPKEMGGPGGAPWGSDLRLYTGVGGIASLHFGPGEVKHAHAPREQVPIADVLDVARTLALLSLRKCGIRRAG